MIQPTIAPLSIEEWIRLEQENDTKYEYYNGEIFAMAGGSHTHGIICDNFFAEALISVRKKGKDCMPFSAEHKLQLPEGKSYVYTDGMIFCGEPEVVSTTDGILANPAVILEVLSDSTEKNDRGEKWRAYRRIPTLQHFIMVRQHQPAVEVYSRRGDLWLFRELTELSDVIVLDKVGIEISLADLYRRINFSTPASDAPAP